MARVALLVGEAGLVSQPHAFQPETQCLPMDRHGDFGGDQRNVEKAPQQRSIGQFPPKPGKAGVEDAFAVFAGVDADREALCGHGQPKVIDQIHIHERRYIECLAAVLPDLADFGFGGGDIGMPLAERVVDFVNDRGEFAVGSVADNRC